MDGAAAGPAAGTGIGQPVRRREDLRLLTGRGRYSDDLNLPGQAYAVMVRSPHAHAMIRRIDTAVARAAPGVLAVLTAEDVEADGLHPLPNIANTHPADISIRNRDGSPAVRPQQAAIIGPEVCHIGEIVAAIIGTSVAAAKDAAELVAVDYEVLRSVCHSRSAAEPEAPRARQNSPNVILDGEVGDAQATEIAFARAAHVVRLDTWVQRIAGVPMEPRAAIGEFDPATGRYTLYAGAGGAVSPRRDLATVLGVPVEQARVVMHDVGGNFGTRGGFNPEFAIVPWAARRMGRPVKWTGDRSEYFMADHQARDLAVSAELALDAEGRFLAMRGSNLVNQGAYALAFGSLNKGVEIMSSIYHVPVVHFRARAALTNTAPTRPYRSSGRPEVMFVMERLIDLAARQTGIDRIELRRRNLVPESMMPYTNPFGMVYDSGAYHRVMERVLEIADWRGFPSRREEARRHGKRRGIGIANYVDTATGAPREKAEITVKPEGVIEVVVGTVSQGQGHETSFAQLVTEWLGVPIDTVRLVTGDTERVSIGGGAHSGRALRLASIVMLNSSNQIIEKGLRIASHVLEAAVEDIDFIAGRFEVKGTDRSVGIFELAKAALERSDLPEELRGPLRGESDETVNLAAFPYGCHVCEVEVDPDTGVAEIVRYSAVDDCGRAINPLIVHGQIHGGIVQGVGQALWEQVVYDPENGQLLSGTFMDYAMPKADRLPFFTTELSEVPSPTHPLGMRPAGEGGTTPALAVVVNAIVDALSEFGVSHIEMPATPERVWRAIHGRDTSSERAA
ncbi:MAG TPA: xanthine dehydrogenase family protein molybdopterin-binding subunit [Stellaceae bacterium]|jgi:carbon-monoxide dehydrogenase large subunit|nr:xanthine dehydrogenase family protein molybdopterin-binding subunit [Stellaceae bacterium]